jgi:hypothetical protein
MARWHDLPPEIKTKILRTAVTSIARVCDSFIRQWGVRPALLFSYYRSIPLTCREFHIIVSYIRVDGVNVDVSLQRIQYRMLSTLTSFAGATWDVWGENYRFLQLKSALGQFWRNPMVLRDPPLVIGLLETVAEPFRPWLLVQMEEFVTLNGQSIQTHFDDNLYMLSKTDCPVGENGKSLGVADTLYFMITKGDREIEFRGGGMWGVCSVNNISDIRYVLDCEDLPPPIWSRPIPGITESSSMGNWWCIVFDDVPGWHNWYLINFVDGLVFTGNEERIVTFATILSESRLEMGVEDETEQVPRVKPVSRGLPTHTWDY